ncbi:MAG: AraC family transcriptional regulator [Planctomycetota bacterium]|nr:AraC family transcriptional regulator [Planctomycetota bacterium]
MDVLTDVMQTVRLRSTLCGLMEMTAPWGVRMPPPAGSRLWFVVVSRGTCSLEMEGLEGSLPLAGGDLVIGLSAGGCVLRDGPGSLAEPFEQLAQAGEAGAGFVVRQGGGGAAVRLVWGAFTIEDRDDNPLMASLPAYIHIRAEQSHSVASLASTLACVVSEAGSEQPGAYTIVSRMADVLFVQAVRLHLREDDPSAAGWLRALSHPQIGAALRLLHESPADPWTVQSLAQSVGMSRSTLSAQFSRLVGHSPMHYLTSWRMYKAATSLREGASIARVARTVGYSTDAAFSKAFRRHIGRAPGEYRRSRRCCPGQADARGALAGNSD